jgi:hypothetical protein
MDECPICYNEKDLVILDGCYAQKHKVCKECYNKSDGKCWLCGDRIGDLIMERMEEGRLSRPPRAQQVHPLEDEITISNHDEESCIEIMKRIIDGICIVTPLICMTIVVGKIIETIFCKIAEDDECSISDLSIEGGYYVSGFFLTIFIWIYILIKVDDCRNNRH